MHLRTAATAIALGGSLAACLSSENVELGVNLDAAILLPPAQGLGGGLPTQVGAPPISVSVYASSGTICEGGCIDLLGMASGSGPFQYAWGEGLGEGEGPKRVCPSTTTTYTVTASPVTSNMQATGSATVTVVACDAGSTTPTMPTDAGRPATGSRDAAAAADSGSASAAVCISNPSFQEMAPTTIGKDASLAPLTGLPPNWQACSGQPNLNPSVSLLPAVDGGTYVGLAVGSGAFSAVTASIGTQLCAPLQPGTRYSFCIDVGIGVQGVMATPPTPGAPAPSLEVWGGTSACAQTALLWTTPSIVNNDSWTVDCGTFTPNESLAYLTLVPVEQSTGGAGASSYVIVDHITSVP